MPREIVRVVRVRNHRQPEGIDRDLEEVREIPVRARPGREPRETDVRSVVEVIAGDALIDRRIGGAGSQRLREEHLPVRVIRVSATAVLAVRVSRGAGQPRPPWRAQRGRRRRAARRRARARRAGRGARSRRPPALPASSRARSAGGSGARRMRASTGVSPAAPASAFAASSSRSGARAMATSFIPEA